MKNKADTRFPRSSDPRSLMKDESGAVMIMGLVMAMFLTGALWYTYGLGRAIAFRDHMQDASDAIAFSSASIQARGMNFISSLNFILLAFTVIWLVTWLVLIVLGGIGLGLLACDATGVGAVACGGPTIEDGKALHQVWQFKEKYEKFLNVVFPGTAVTQIATSVVMPWVASFQSYRLSSDFYGQKGIGLSLTQLPWPLPDGLKSVIANSIPGGTELYDKVKGKGAKDAIGAEGEEFDYQVTLLKNEAKAAAEKEKPLDADQQKILDQVGHLEASEAAKNKRLSARRKLVNIFAGRLGLPVQMESGGAMCNTVIGFGFAQADQLMEASGLLKFLDGTASKVTSGAIGFVNDKLNPFSDIKDPLKDLRENIESKISKLMGNFTEKTFCNGGFWEWPGSMAYWRPAKGNMSDWQQTYGLIWDPKFEDKEARIVEMADGKPAGAGFKAPDDVADFYFSQAEFYLDCKGRWEDADCNNNLPNVDFSMFQMRWRARLIRVHPINVGAALLQPIIDFAVGTAVDKFIKGPITDAIGNRLEKTAVWKKVIGKRIEGGAGEKISKFLLKRVSREAEKSIDKNKSSLKKKYLTPDVKWDPFGDEVYH
ncbi:MAG: hypothetical protein KBF88_10990 [Polyangiaceae bacterium]|nr:hypothetical protein [Polyangiaceae bacterium]